MKVFEVMSTEVQTCGPDDGLDEAARIMWQHDCGCVPVVDDDGRVLGMVTDRDVCMATWTRGLAPASLRVGETMAERVHVCRPDDDLVLAERTMREQQVRRLPVVDGNDRLVGLLSLADLAREARRQRDRRETELCTDEVAMTLAAIGQRREEGSPGYRIELTGWSSMSALWPPA